MSKQFKTSVVTKLNSDFYDQFLYWSINVADEKKYQRNSVWYFAYIVGNFANQLDAHTKSGKTRTIKRKKTAEKSNDFTSQLLNKCDNVIETFKSILVFMSPLQGADDTQKKSKPWFEDLQIQFAALSILGELKKRYEWCTLPTEGQFDNTLEYQFFQLAQILNTEAAHLETRNESGVKQISVASLYQLILFRIQTRLTWCASKAALQQTVHYRTDQIVMLDDFVLMSQLCDSSRSHLMQFHDNPPDVRGYNYLLEVFSYQNETLDHVFALCNDEVPLFQKDSSKELFFQQLDVLLVDFEKWRSTCSEAELLAINKQYANTKQKDVSGADDNDETAKDNVVAYVDNDNETEKTHVISQQQSVATQHSQTAPMVDQQTEQHPAYLDFEETNLCMQCQIQSSENITLQQEVVELRRKLTVLGVENARLKERLERLESPQEQKPMPPSLPPQQDMILQNNAENTMQKNDTDVAVETVAAVEKNMQVAQLLQQEREKEKETGQKVAVLLQEEKEKETDTVKDKQETFMHSKEKESNVATVQHAEKAVENESTDDFFDISDVLSEQKLLRKKNAQKRKLEHGIVEIRNYMPKKMSLLRKK